MNVFTEIQVYGDGCWSISLAALNFRADFSLFATDFTDPDTEILFNTDRGQFNRNASQWTATFAKPKALQNVPVQVEFRPPNSFILKETLYFSYS